MYNLNYYIHISSKEILRYEDALNEKNELLYKMAYIDSLTMIYNRVVTMFPQTMRYAVISPLLSISTA